MTIPPSTNRNAQPPPPPDSRAFTERLDREYTRYARLYDLAVKRLPLWKTWITAVCPHITGPKVLEASFGTGYLLMQIAGRYDTWGIDYNERMVRIASDNLARRGLRAKLRQANVEALPFPDGFFDTVVNTMALSGYPDGEKAVAEFRRVLRPGGRLLVVDFQCPPDGNRMGNALVRLMEKSGDIIKDIPALLNRFAFHYTERPIGGFGSVQLYIATRQGPAQTEKTHGEN